MLQTAWIYTINISKLSNATQMQTIRISTFFITYENLWLLGGLKVSLYIWFHSMIFEMDRNFWNELTRKVSKLFFTEISAAFFFAKDAVMLNPLNPLKIG